MAATYESDELCSGSRGYVVFYIARQYIAQSVQVTTHNAKDQTISLHIAFMPSRSKLPGCMTTILELR